MRNNKSLKDARELSGLLRFKVTEPNTRRTKKTLYEGGGGGEGERDWKILNFTASTQYLPIRNHSPFVMKSEISPPSSDFNIKSSCVYLKRETIHTMRAFAFAFTFGCVYQYLCAHRECGEKFFSSSRMQYQQNMYNGR